jgi:VIT1/CCC1 family predicted Fe2+/Mn2+ transporter
LVVFGMNDGVVTSVGFLAGVHASIRSPRAVLLAGLAEAFAGALSMAFGEYVAARSEREWFEHRIARERRHIRERPEQEREEVRAVYRARGFAGEELEAIVRHITSDRDRWLEFMLREELGLLEEHQAPPLRSAVIIGGAFALGAAVPIVPYLASPGHPFRDALAMGGLGLFALGAGKAAVTRGSWLRSGLEMVAVGAVASTLGYILGAAAARLVAP